MMKKTILHLFSLILLSFSLHGQVLLNGNFEHWITLPGFNFEDPDGWISSNAAGVPAGLPANVIKITDAYDGDFALRLETIDDPNGEPFIGGVVCNTTVELKPMMIQGYYKSMVVGNDEAGMAIILQSNGVAIGGGDIVFEPNQSNWTYFEVPIDYFVGNEDPDFFTLTALSSAEGGEIGSTLYLDNLTFDGISSNADVKIGSLDVSWSPNPASSVMNFQIENNNDLLNMKVYDQQGRLISTYDFRSQLKLDLTKYNQGQYFFVIRDEELNFFSSDSFIVNK